jgi:putative peptidoglycan lipid II flippase
MSQSLFRSTAIVSMMTFLSRIMGFVRDMVVAQIFGAGGQYDAFVVAFKIPNFFRRLFAEGSFTQAFVPVLAEFRETRTPQELRQFVSDMSGVLAASLLLVMLLAMLLAPLLVLGFAPGFSYGSEKFDLAARMLRINFPYLLLISLAAFTGSLLNSFSRFAVPAFTPVLLNIAMIIACLYFTPYFSEPIVALAWGVVLGGVVQFIFQLPFVYRLGFLCWPRFNWRNEGVRKVLKLMVPAILGVSVAQISILIDTVFASFLASGSISWLYYSERLMTFPLGVFGVAIATVILPRLAREHAGAATSAFSASLDWGLRCICVISIPAAVGLCLLSGPLLTSLFRYGAFSRHAVEMSQLSLIAYSLGLPGFMLIKVLVAGFYAKQNIKTPVRIAIIALVANMILNSILIYPLRHTGLALATTFSSMLNAALLFYLLVKFQIYKPGVGWWMFLLRILLANVVLASLLYLLNKPLEVWLAWSWQIRFSYLFLIILVAILVYLLTLYAMGMRIRDFRPRAMG